MIAGVALLLCAAGPDPVVERPTGVFSAARLDLDGTPVHVALRDGRAVNIHVVGSRDPFLRSDLLLADGRLKGVIRDDHPCFGGKGQALSYTIDATVDGEGRVTGTFSGRVAEGGWRHKPAKYDVKELREVTGKVSGRILNASAAARENGLAVGAHWSGWDGPSGARKATDTEVTLVDDLAAARLVWVSEAGTPGAPGPSKDIPRTMARAPFLPMNGGGATPVVADNKVFLRYTQPFGDVYDTTLYAKYVALGYSEATLARCRRVLATSSSDVVVAFDARTGARLWRTTFPDAGINFHGHKIAQNNLSATWHDGRVFAVGSTLRFYALDADTGEPLWQADLGEEHARMEAKKREALREKRFLGNAYGNRQWGFVPVGIGDLVVCNDKRGGLVAFDVKTGKKRWRAENVIHSNASPVPWRGRLVMAARERVVCVNPADGGEVWSIPAMTGRGIVIDGDRLLFLDLLGTPGPDRPKDPKQAEPACLAYRLTDEGPKLAWSVPWHLPSPDGKPVKDQYSGYVVPVVHEGRVYISGRVWTDCLDLETGRRLARAESEGGVANAGHLFFAHGRLFANRDGKHGTSELTMFDPDPAEFRTLGTVNWSPPHPNTTSYGPYLRFPVVDGRIFIRGNDAIYCYDLRKR